MRVRFVHILLISELWFEHILTSPKSNLKQRMRVLQAKKPEAPFNLQIKEMTTPLIAQSQVDLQQLTMPILIRRKEME